MGACSRFEEERRENIAYICAMLTETPRAVWQSNSKQAHLANVPAAGGALRPAGEGPHSRAL